MLFGAARVGALNGLLAPLAQTTGNSFTTINYQGRLADSSGAPIDNPNPGVGMTFALYDVETGGSPLWSETHAAVRVNEGLFSVKLGSVNALSASLLSGDRWLGIRVGADTEMTPREKLAAVPYAMVAGEALTVADGSVTSAKLSLPSGQIMAAGDFRTTSSEWVPVPDGVVTVTLSTASKVLIIFAGDMSVNTQGSITELAIAIDGQVYTLPKIEYVNAVANMRVTGSQSMIVELDPGSHYIQLNLRSNDGIAEAYLGHRSLSVLAFN